MPKHVKNQSASIYMNVEQDGSSNDMSKGASRSQGVRSSKKVSNKSSKRSSMQRSLGKIESSVSFRPIHASSGRASCDQLVKPSI